MSNLNGQGVYQSQSGPMLGQVGDMSNSATVNFNGPTSAQGPQTQQQATAYMPAPNGQPPQWAYPNQHQPHVPPSDVPPAQNNQGGLVQMPITAYMPSNPPTATHFMSPSSNSAFRSMGHGPDPAQQQPEIIRSSGMIWLSNHLFEDVNGGKSHSCLHCGIPADFFRVCPGFDGCRAPVDVHPSASGESFSHWLVSCHNILKSKRPGDTFSKVHGNGKCQNNGCVFNYWDAHNHPCPKNPNPVQRRAGGGAFARK